MEIKLYNTLSRKIEDFKPIDKSLVKIYSCGPTVYDYAHIGNIRAFLFADLLQKVLRVVGGYKVKWVLNITDIDDKTIKSIAKNSGKWRDEMGEWSGDPKADLVNYTNFFLNEFLNDISKVAIFQTDIDTLPRATEYINGMIDLIKKIYDNGFAYESDGNIYFSVSKWREKAEYGRLKNIDFENFREGVRIEADEYQRDQVSDFVLWKSKKDGEPFWEFDHDGKHFSGRPGWHLECSVMEHDILGLPFDIHTGGVDLQFPHHEDEIAQSHSGYGVDPTNYWCHNEFLEVEGEKMSKSAGNFFSLRDLVNKGYDPLDVRFAMLSQHYRKKFNFTLKGIEDAAKARKKIQDFIFNLMEDSNGKDDISELINKMENNVFQKFASDLNTPNAIAEIFSFINKVKVENINSSNKDQILNYFNKLNEIFNIWTFEKIEMSNDIPEDILNLAQKRFEAKLNKNWSLADSLRDEISQNGFKIIDKKDSFEVEKI